MSLTKKQEAEIFKYWEYAYECKNCKKWYGSDYGKDEGRCPICEGRVVIR